MKRPGIFVFIMLTVLFAGFICGFFLGRNLNHSDIQLGILDPVSTTIPSSGIVAETPSSSSQASAAQIESTNASNSTQSDGGKVNINTADKDALMTLPGIGEVLAQRILDYRDANGPFTSLSDLLLVEGIGEKRLDAIWDYITIGG